MTSVLRPIPMSSSSNKTPLRKRNAKKVFNTASPCARMPGAVVFINDDEEERRQRRLESHMRNAMSPGSAAKPQNE